MVERVFFPSMALVAEATPKGLVLEWRGTRLRGDGRPVGMTLGPGPELIVLSADGRLSRLDPRRPDRELFGGVVAAEGDTACLAAALENGTLILQGRRSATSVGIGAVPEDVAVWGQEDGSPHLVGLVIRGEAHILTWDEGSGRLSLGRLRAPPLTHLWLLGGPDPLLLARGPVGPVDRLIPFSPRPGMWFGTEWHEGPPLFVSRGGDIGAVWDGRNWTCLAGAGGWFRRSGVRWEPCPDPAPPSHLMGRRFGDLPAVGPAIWGKVPSVPKSARERKLLGMKDVPTSGEGSFRDSRLAPTPASPIEWPARRDRSRDAPCSTSPSGRVTLSHHTSLPRPLRRPGGL